MAAALTVDCRKTFPGRFSAAAQFTLPLDPPRVLILFGPSGSGKTTCLAGLEWPEEGRIQYGSDLGHGLQHSALAKRGGSAILGLCALRSGGGNVNMD
jgi:ABC-type Fe3+/spermidine/putrescine transport system ATPase subunit